MIEHSESASGDGPVVVKIGGARAVDPVGALTDVAHLTANGKDVIVLHGGSTAVDDTLADLGEEPIYVETPDGVAGRFTDEGTMDVIEMVLPGLLNTDLVATLQNEGVDAVGLTGVDGKLLTGPRTAAVRVQEDGKRKIKRGDHSGRITEVNGVLLETLLEAGYTPTVTIPMLADDSASGRDPGTGDAPPRDWLPVNVDTDRAAAAIAGELDATLVVLTDVPGVLADPDDPSTLIGTVDTPAALEQATGAAAGFMTRKVMAAVDALEAGAKRVVVARATPDEPVLEALDGGGTQFLPGAVGGDDDAEASASERSDASNDEPHDDSSLQEVSE